MQVLEETSRTLGYWEEHPRGELIEDRGSQVTYSALGQAAPLDANKAYAVRKLMTQIHAAPEELLFVGDRLDEAGNDYPVLAVGVPCVPVTSWQDTLTVIAQFIEWWDGVTGSPQFRIISNYPDAARHGRAGA